MQGSDEENIMLSLINPDTGTKIFQNGQSSFYCEDKNIDAADGIIDLRPGQLDCEEKINEDRIHVNEKLLTKKEIFHQLEAKKAGHIRNFTDLWLPQIEPWLKEGNSFLEIGGGYCYVSAIVKDRFKNIEVCASDISPQYLRKRSMPMAKEMFTIIPDYYIALDAEKMPFEDSCIDIIWTHSSMHHFSSVPKFLREANRVLKEDGLLCAIDTADPWLYTKNGCIKKRNRARQFNIFEKYYTIFDWMKISRKSKYAVRYLKGKRIKSYALKFLLNSIRPIGIIYSNRDLRL